MKTHSEKVREVFAFQLLDTELLAKGQQASELNLEIADKEYKLAVYRKERKAEIDNLQSKLNYVLKLVSTKREDREVECDKVYNYDTKTVTYLYRGEIMRERPMEQFEFQTQFAVSPETPSAVV